MFYVDVFCNTNLLFTPTKPGQSGHNTSNDTQLNAMHLAQISRKKKDFSISKRLSNML